MYQLNDLGEMMKKEYRSKTRDQRKKSERADKKAMKQFKLALLQLEKDWEETKLCEESAYFKNPSLLNTLWPWIQLFLGIISSILSFFWILHICLFQLPVTFGGRALTPFLNSYFQSFDSWFPLFGVISVGMFTFYMLLAVMLGNFKFGMRILIIPLHPMIKGKTLMNTILFNINLIMLCTIPTLQFSVDAFQEYARLTDINTIINVQIRYLEFYQFFYSNNITKNSLPSWEESIKEGFRNPYVLLSQPSKIMTCLREIVPITKMADAFNEGYLEYGIFVIKKY